MSALAALQFTGAALGVAGLERVGRNDSECSEGSDGEESREADVHVLSGRVSGLGWSEAMRRCFPDSELFYDSFPLPLYHFAHSSFSAERMASAKRSGIPVTLPWQSNENGKTNVP